MQQEQFLADVQEMKSHLLSMSEHEVREMVATALVSIQVLTDVVTTQSESIGKLLTQLKGKL